MHKYLITGVSGFVAKHFIEFLKHHDPGASVCGVDLNSPDWMQGSTDAKMTFYVVDLVEREALEEIVFEFQPTHILHLASFSSVAFSWKNPVSSFRNNMDIYLNLLEVVRELAIPSRVLSIGSSEEYGIVTQDGLPLEEDAPLAPISPYAVARVAQEQISKVYVQGFGMDIVMTRSFNHIGPFQRETFVISSLARQLVEIEKTAKGTGQIVAGNLDIVRDFLDVRDVVAAYFKLLHEGGTGEVYNVCSGKGISIREALLRMSDIMQLHIDIKSDPHLVRPSDNPVIVGTNEKIHSQVGWSPTISLDQSLEDIIEYWRGV